MDTVNKEWNIKVVFITFYKFSVTVKKKMSVIDEMARQINNDAYNRFVNIEFELRNSKAKSTYGETICTMKYKQLKSQRNGSNQRGNVIITLLVDLLCKLNPVGLYEYCSKAYDNINTEIKGVYFDANNDRPDICSEYMNYNDTVELAKVLGYNLECSNVDFQHFRIMRYR